MKVTKGFGEDGESILALGKDSNGRQVPLTGRVLVVDEADVFGSGRYKDAMRDGASAREALEASYAVARSWLYTAVTRAQDQVSIVSKGSLRLT